MTVRPSTVSTGEGKVKKPSFVWSSSDETIAKVSKAGAIKGISAGEALITCSSAEDSSVYTNLYVHVLEPVKKISIDDVPASLLIGAPLPGLNEADLSVSVSPADATCKDVIWKSSDPEIVSVDENGHLFAKNTGKVTITAVSAELGAKQIKKDTVSVNAGYAVKSIIDDNSQLVVGTKKQIQLKPRILPDDAKQKNLIWSADTPRIAAVDNQGIVKGNAIGICKIRAYSADMGGAEIEYTVRIVKQIESIMPREKEIHILVGHNKFVDIDIKPYDATYIGLDWTSSNPVIADIDISNKLIAKRTGKCTVTGKTKDGSNKSITITVYVEKSN